GVLATIPQRRDRVGMAPAERDVVEPHVVRWAEARGARPAATIAVRALDRRVVGAPAGVAERRPGADRGWFERGRLLAAKERHWIAASVTAVILTLGCLHGR